MPDIEAPEIEVDEDAPQFRRRLALVVVAITLFAAVVAYLHEQNSNFEDNASRDAQMASIRAFGRTVDAQSRAGFSYDAFIQKELLLRRAVIAGGRARSTDDTTLALYQADTDRYNTLNSAVGNETEVQSTSDDITLRNQLNTDPDRQQLIQQAAANKSNDYGNKADSYVAVLTVLAVGLFLIGLSLTVSGRGRYLLAIPGVAVALICVVWAVNVTLGGITKVSNHAIDLAVEGQRLDLNGDSAGAIKNYRDAVDDSPKFAEAWARLASAEFSAGGNGGDLQSISDPEATKRAIDAGDKAVSLGISDPFELSSIGFYHFTVGDYDRAESLAQQALQSNDKFPPLLLNLGVVQVAKGEADAAKATYEQAISLVSDTRFDIGRADILASARTDLEIAEQLTPDSHDLAETMKGMLSVVEARDLAGGATLPDRAPDNSSVSDVSIGVDRFRLVATYNADGFDANTPLVNVWYFRGNERNGNGPFQQIASMDTVSTTGSGSVSTVPKENGPCLPGGDYRVDVYAGPDLVGSGEGHIVDSPLGELQPQGGEDLGFTMCVPTKWVKDDQVSKQPGTLAFQNPDDGLQVVFATSFPIGASSAGDLAAAVDANNAEAARLLDVQTGPTLTGGSELLALTISGDDVSLPTRNLEGTGPDNQQVLIIGSVASDNVYRLVVVGAANTADLHTVTDELVNSIRFLRLPDTTPPSGG